MENDEKISIVTTENPAVDLPVRQALDADNSTNGGMPPADRRVGGQPGNKNGASRGGAWALNRGRQKNLPVDRRTRSGRVERMIQELLTADYGGPQKITTRQMILIGLVSLDCARLDQHKRSRRLLIRKKKEGAKARGIDPRLVEHPKEIAALDAYMQPVLTSLRSSLQALGPEPEKQQERLEDVLAKIAKESEQEGGVEVADEGNNVQGPSTADD
jgi:hypothetical protein